jgi:hypothetical protein
MRSRLLILSAAAALAVSTPIAAQSTKSSDEHAGRTVKLTGCVERASDVLGQQGESGYVLAHSQGGRSGVKVSPQSGRVFQLDASSEDSKLTQQLGNRVTITGQVSSPRTPSSATAGTSGREVPRATDRASTEHLPTLTVTSVKQTPGACPAGW